MPRKYRDIQQYEKEILELWEQGLSKREIGEKFGLSKEQIKGFLKRYRKKEHKKAVGIALRKKGRPPKDCIIREEDRLSELRYILARKEAKIKSLEMENELIRDFFSLTERK